MNRIIYVGMDVHLTSFSVCCVQPEIFEEDKVFGHMKLKPEVRSVQRYIDKISDHLEKAGVSAHFIFGYEAGFSGYSLYHDMTAVGLECIILAPSTMKQRPKHAIKTDKRDAEHIAKCLAYGDYQPVYIPTADDEQVRDYLRMRNDHQQAWKKVKQQINAFCLRLGKYFTGGRNKWTELHLDWLHDLVLDPLHREILDEYLITYDLHVTRLAAFDERINELAALDCYRERVHQLSCFLGIKTYTGLSLLVETGDFTRFSRADCFASYLGLTPGEQSSGETIRRGGITKAGNKELRRLLVEAAQSIGRGRIGYKSKALKARQKGNDSKVIAYADRANERLRRKFYRMTKQGKKYNVAITAIARELACFIWGMMTNHLDVRQAG